MGSTPHSFFVITSPPTREIVSHLWGSLFLCLCFLDRFCTLLRLMLGSGRSTRVLTHIIPSVPQPAKYHFRGFSCCNLFIGMVSVYSGLIEISWRMNSTDPESWIFIVTSCCWVCFFHRRIPVCRNAVLDRCRYWSVTVPMPSSLQLQRIERLYYLFERSVLAFWAGRNDRVQFDWCLGSKKLQSLSDLLLSKIMLAQIATKPVLYPSKSVSFCTVHRPPEHFSFAREV